MTKVSIGKFPSQEMFDAPLGRLIQIAQQNHGIQIELEHSGGEIWVKTNADIDCLEFIKIVLNILTIALVNCSNKN